MQIIEQLLGVAPDGGNGSLEVALAVLLTAVVVVGAVRRRWNRRA
ncbi:MAG: hypothetical protein ABI910_19135 [Gemmatimonadota bacterium]